MFPEEPAAKKKDDKAKKAEPKKKGGGLFGFFKKKQPAAPKEEVKKPEVANDNGRPSGVSLLNDSAKSIDPLKHEDVDIELEPNQNKASDRKAADPKVAADSKPATDMDFDAAGAHAEHNDIHHDINGKVHKAAWAEPKPDNCLMSFGKRLFKRWFPYHSVLPQTEWAKKLKL